MARELICIQCPNGCHLLAEETSEGFVIKGNKCSKGEEYGKEEMTSPKRTVTAVVKTNSPILPYAPVKTDKPLVKKLIPDLLKNIYSLQTKTPIVRGDKLIANFMDSGVNVVFTRTIL